MTTQPYDDDEVTPAPVSFSAKRRDTTGDRVPFTIDDDDTILWARRPKMAVLLRITRQMTDAGSDDLAAVAGFQDFMDELLEPDSRDYLAARFEDPDDPLDLDALDEPLQYFIGLWYGRPTGPRSASAGSRKPTGKRSTVRQRSPGSTP